MPRRASFLAASPQAATNERRRRSADDRVLSVHTTSKGTLPSSGSVSGVTPDQPILIPSDDEKESIEHKKSMTKGPNIRRNELRTPTKADRTSSVQDPPPPPAAVESRPYMPRMAQTDPEVDRLSGRIEKANMSPLQSLCGKPYLRRGYYEKHQRNCSECRIIQGDPSRSEVPAAGTSPERSHSEYQEARSIDSVLSAPPRSANTSNSLPTSPSPATPSPATPSPTIEHLGQSDGLTVNPKTISAKDIDADLLVKVCAPLKTQPDRAHVYLFRSPERPDLVKVGITGNIESRKKRFKSHCGHEMETIDIWPNKQDAKHIEALVKKDLQHLKRPWPCTGRKCGAEHREWFKIGSERAREIVQMWVDWLELCPYDTKRNLKPLWVHLLNAGGRPAARFSNGAHEARHAHWQDMLRKPTQDEMDNFNLLHPKAQEQQKPGDEDAVVRVDSPQRAAPPATPVQNHTYNITDNSVNKYKDCQVGNRSSIGAPP